MRNIFQRYLSTKQQVCKIWKFQNFENVQNLKIGKNLIPCFHEKLRKNGHFYDDVTTQIAMILNFSL